MQTGWKEEYCLLQCRIKGGNVGGKDGRGANSERDIGS